MRHNGLHGKPLVIAHRGGSALAFENTLSAFLEAEKLGVFAAELDVHLSKDNNLIVIHDPDLKRIANDSRSISEMTTEEIKNVELPGGERVPDLISVFETVDIPIIIELKTPATLPVLEKLFRNHPGYFERSQVISFFHDTLRLLKQEFPEIITGALLSGFPVNPSSIVQDSGADILSLDFDGLWKGYVDQCHEHGFQVSTWTVNRDSDIKKAIDMEVDYITSDRPDQVIKTLKGFED